MPASHPRHNRPVLVVSDDPNFVHGIRERWEVEAPELRIVGSAACAGCNPDDFQFVLVGGLQPEVCSEVLAAFRPGNIPVIVIGGEGARFGLGERHASKMLVLPSFPGWQSLLVALGEEVVRRAEALARARRSEMNNATLQCDAMLGRYVIEMRHNMNNALTSVLGNAELLLLDETKFSEHERKQIDTIRLMALRMHETLQRFSSLEKELRVTGAPRVEVGSGRGQQDFKTQDRKPAEGLQGPQLARAAGAD